MSSKKRIIKVSAFLVSATIYFSSMTGSFASNDLNSKLNHSKTVLDTIQSSISKNNSEIEAYKDNINININKQVDVNAEIQRLQSEKASLEEQINFISSQIQTTLDKIFELESEILKIEKNIQVKQNEISELEKRIKTNTKLLEERLIVMYKLGDAEKIEILLSSQDINDFLSRNKMMTTITEHDQNLIKSLKEDKNKLDKLVLELNGQKKVLEISKQNNQNQKEELESQKAIQTDLLQQVKEKEAENYERLSELDRVISQYEEYLSEKLASREELETQKANLQTEIQDLEYKINLEIERIEREKEAERAAEEEKRAAAEQSARLEELSKKKTELEVVEEKIENVSSTRLAWPTSATYISSPFGWREGFYLQDGRWYPDNFHYGIDLAGPIGTPIYAAEDGVITKAEWYGGYGNLIIIDHGNGMTTRYGHLDSITVSVGQRVSRGSYIGPMGTTGNSSGSHLHFEVRINGEAQDPLNYIR